MISKMANRTLCLLIMIAMASCLVLSVDDLCYPGANMLVVQVKEDIKIGEIILHVPFAGSSDQIDLQPDINDYFEFNTTTRNITVKAELDSETQKSVNELNIACRERDSKSGEVDISIQIILVDVNDNSPEFSQSIYYLNVSEDVPLNEYIFTNIVATDNDSAGNGLLLYSIVPGPHSDYFFIEDPLNCILRLQRKLDFETSKTMTIDILAKDQPTNEPTLSSTTRLNITVLDADDKNPEFTKRKYTGRVMQNSLPGTPINVTKIQASDPDVTINSPVTYTLIDLEDLFEIDANTAEVKVKQSPNSGTYNILVEATEVYNSLRKGTAMLEIIAMKTDSNPPKFEKDTYYLTVPESTPQNSTILTVSAKDTDYGDTISYALATVQTVFGVDKSSGEVTIKESLDFEEQQEYNLLVTATDGIHIATVVVQVRVTDVNDNDPFVDNRHINIEQDRTTGAIITKIEVSDLDENSLFTFQLLNHQDLFTVSDEGVVSITGLGEELTENRYDLLIEITDNGDVPRKISKIVSVRFPTLPRTGAITMLPRDDTLAIVFGVVAAIMLIIIVILIIYIVRRRQQSTEHLNQAKLNRSLDPKGLKFQSNPPSRNPHRININYHGNVDETSDGATTIQENPFNDDHINYGYVHSDSETDRGMGEIQIETAVIPYDAYNSTGEVYRDTDGLPINHIYQNGSLSTFKDNGSSSDSINSESINSKKALMGGSTKRPAMHMMSWDANGNVQSMQSFDPDSAVTPIDEKPEITVYF